MQTRSDVHSGDRVQIIYSDIPRQVGLCGYVEGKVRTDTPVKVVLDVGYPIYIWASRLSVIHPWWKVTE